MPAVWFSGTDHILSNLHASRLFIWNKWFNSVEHAYQYARLVVSNHQRIADEVIAAPSGFDARRLAIGYTTAPLWNKIKEGVMFDILLARVRFDPQYEKYLLSWPHTVEFRELSRHPFWGGQKGQQNRLGQLHKSVQKIARIHQSKTLELQASMGFSNQYVPNAPPRDYWNPALQLPKLGYDPNFDPWGY